MAVWNPKYNYLFLCEPHAASRSSVEALLTHDESREIGHHHIGIPEIRQKTLVPRQRLKDALSFETFRNPYDLLVTRWFYHDRRRHSFADYMRICWEHGQIGGTLFWRTKGVKRYAAHEVLQGSINELLAEVNAPPVTLPFVGVTKDKPKWWTLYDKELLDYVTQHFEDVRRYNYTCFWDDELDLPVSYTNPHISPHLLRGDA